MKNDYEVRGDVTAIFIRRRNGDVLECLIDTEDLDKVKALGVTISVTKKHRNYGGFYAQYHKQIGPKKHTKRNLHRYLLGDPVGMVVDHINGNTLDNRKCNLRSITNAENMQNLTGPHSDNSTGYRGVTRDKSGKRFQAFAQVNKEQHYLGLFSTAEEANQVAIEFRKRHMPFSKDARNAV